MTHFNGADYVHDRDQARLQRQLERIAALMQDGEWRTLKEISAKTGDPEASVSAQLRHLRKPRFGAFLIDRVHVGGGLYSYRMRSPKFAEGSNKDATEFEIQCAYIRWLRGVPKKGVPPALIAPGICWHVPNGGTRRDEFEGKRFKDAGVLAGNPDVHILNQRLFLVELKRLGETRSDAQISLHPQMRAAGATVAVADTLNAAKWWAWMWGLVTPQSMHGVDFKAVRLLEC